METAVFLFAGFMDAGKTTGLLGALQKSYQPGDAKSIIVCMEEGEETYPDQLLEAINAEVIYVEEKEEVTLEFWERIAQKEQPERIFIEFNGMWNLKAFLEQPLPRGWYYSTIFSFVDAMTYALYLKNMRLIIMSPLSVSDVIIFNRCDESFPREDTRRAIKLLNPNAEVFFTRPDGTLETCSDILLESDKDGVLTISEDMFCRWFVDTIEHTDRYYGRKVRFTGMVTRDLHASGKRFYLGRYVLICCPEDAQFVGFVAELADCDRSYDSGDEISNLSGNTTENLKNINPGNENSGNENLVNGNPENENLENENPVIKNGDWIEVEAVIKKGLMQDRQIVVLQITDWKHTPSPEDIYLYCQ